MKRSKEVRLSDHVPSRIWTVGHSTRSADEFNDILQSQQISALVDVRSFSGSRRYPHFNKDELSRTVDSIGIAYFHLPELGGRRRPSPNSKNAPWMNASFRAYADHVESQEFQKGIDGLLKLAGEKRTAVMCAEA